VRLFAGKSIMEIARAVRAGELSPPKRPSNAPPWRGAPSCGLAGDPADRHPGMLALLDALGRGSARRRRRWIAAAAIRQNFWKGSRQNFWNPQLS